MNTHVCEMSCVVIDRRTLNQKNVSCVSCGVVSCRVISWHVSSCRVVSIAVLFRPVSMMIPDYALIAEIMLFAEGFDSASVLSKKMVCLWGVFCVVFFLRETTRHVTSRLVMEERQDKHDRERHVTSHHRQDRHKRGDRAEQYRTRHFIWHGRKTRQT